MERLSPELTLVDPELARRARRELREPSDCLARPPSVASSSGAGLVASTLPTAPSGGARRSVVPSGAPTQRRGDSLPSFRVVVGALLVALLVGSPAVELLRSGGVGLPHITAGEKPPAPLPSADASEPADEILPIRLEWPKVKGADFYDVVLWRDGRRVTDLWPRTNGVAITKEPPLRPGTYQWFAIPAFTEGASTRYGRSVARGEFRLS